MLETYLNYTKASKIVNLIMENHNWQTMLEDMKIKVKYDDNGLAIFNYELAADFSNEIVQEARGIIIDMNTLEVVCWPFRKFGNYFESYVDEIDWSTARCQEKLDGSIIKLFWNKYTNEWQWATNGVIDARNSECSSLFSNTFYDIIKKADNLKDINFDILDKTKTYIFELVGPENQIVIRYDNIHLYHLGTRSNIDGQEYNEDIGIEKPKEYSLHSFEDCLEAAEKLNVNTLVDHEGFVVVDDNWNRIKIKSPSYVAMHHLANNGQLITSKEKVIDLLLSDDFNKEEVLKQYPEYEKVFNFYENEIKRVEKEVDGYIWSVRQFYYSCGMNRKTVANTIKGDEYAALGFKALDNAKEAKELLEELSRSRYYDLIGDYTNE